MAAAASLHGDELGWRFLEPGLYLTKPIELLSLGLALILAFATIVAVVAGLTLAAASALAHDVYVGALRGGDAPPPRRTCPRSC
jgi:cation/acetate symporter